MLNFFPKLFNQFSVIKIYFFDFLFTPKTKMKKKIIIIEIAQYFRKNKRNKSSKILVNNKKLKVQFFAILRKYEKFFKLIN